MLNWLRSKLNRGRKVTPKNRRRRLFLESLEDRRVLAAVIEVPDEIVRGDELHVFSHGWQDGENVEYEIELSDQSTPYMGTDINPDYHGFSTESKIISSTYPLGTATITATGEFGGVATAEVEIVSSHAGSYSPYRVVGPPELVIDNQQYIYTEGWFAGEKVTYEIVWPDLEEDTDIDYAYDNGLSIALFNVPDDLPEGIATLTMTGEDSCLQFTHEFPVKHLPGSGPPKLQLPAFVVPDEDYDLTGTRFADNVDFFIIQGEDEWSEGTDSPDDHGRIEEEIHMDEDLELWQPVTIEARDDNDNVVASIRAMVVDEVPTWSAYFSGIMASVPIFDVAATYEISASELVARQPSNGPVQNESFADRSARGISPTNVITNTGLTYWDADRGVDVYAPEDKYFVVYDNGAVELRDIPSGLPSGQDHPYVSEVTKVSRTASDLGEVSKPVARTGRTFFDPARGIDVYASEGKYLIEYVDGSIEERNLPTGGFVPRPEDFRSGGSDNSQAKSAFGPTLEQLGLTSGGNPISSDELWLIGKEYVATNGQIRVAHDGNIFLQDPTTGIILERPAADASVALTKPAPTERTLHDSEDVSDLFEDAYGRLPNPFELEYWQNRTDKSGAALLGAMETAYADGVTVSIIPKAPSPEEVDAVFAIFDGQEITQYNPEVWSWDWVVDGVEQQVENFEDWLSDQVDAFKLFADRVTFVPPAPVSQTGLDFYINSPDYVVEQDAQPGWLVNFFHPGGVESWRIRRVGSVSGVQVVFDANGDIISPGQPGAGSPDMCSPTNGVLTVCHWTLDLSEWWIGETTNIVSSLLP